MDLDDGFASFPVGSGEDILRRIRILGQKQAIPASRGQKVEKTALEKLIFKSDLFLVRTFPCFVFFLIGSPSYIKLMSLK